MPIQLTRRGLILSSVAAAAGTAGFAGALGAQGSAARTNHALLVAVTEYPNLPQSNWLRGPNNDAVLVREYLLTSAPVPFAAANVTVLADDIDIADASPTLVAIRKAMATLAETAQEGDFVYLHFSGHGHQQPARNPEEEIDGLDEVFMPRDVQIMRRGMTEWPNAYVDKDIKDDIDAIRAKGAFVWSVFDCCHSATITRNVLAGDSEEVERKVDLSEIEDYVGPEAFEGVQRGMSGTPRQTMLGDVARGAGAGAGGAVAFYASQTIEPTFEMPLPRGAEDAIRMGLFTFAVLGRLAENPAVTYRQLGDAVLQSYVAMNRTRPIPMFEGDLDTAVFAAGDLDYVPQWPVQRADGQFEIAAGHVHRLAPGTRMAVLPAANATLDAALGLIEIASVAAMRSTLGPLTVAEDEDAPDLPALALDDIPEGAVARVIEQVIPMELSVALPRGEEFSGDARRISDMLETLAADEEQPFRLRLVPAGTAADLRLDVMSPAGVARMVSAQEDARTLDAATRDILATAATRTEPRLWLLDAAANVSLAPGLEPPSLGLEGLDDDEAAEWLRDAMVKAYRATNLARLAGQNDFAGASDVRVELYIKRGGAEAEVLATSTVPRVQPLDEVWLRVANTGSTAVDVHALFIGTDFSIVPARNAERLQPGNSFDRGLFRISDETFGRERVVVALAEAEGMTPVLNLGFLASEGVQTRGLGGTRGVASGLRGLVQDVADAPMTRSAMAMGDEAERGREALMVFSLDVLPEV